jgi:hypothetical protein
MTRASHPPRTYHGHRASPLPGLAGWYTVPSLGVHFRIDGPGESLRSEVCHRPGGTSQAELWARDGSGQQLLWSRDYRPGDLSWAPYRDVMTAAAEHLARR